jgi:hypothetical protein
MAGAPAHREAVYALIALRWGGAAGLAAWNGSVPAVGDGQPRRSGLDRSRPPYAFLRCAVDRDVRDGTLRGMRYLPLG